MEELITALGNMLRIHMNLNAGPKSIEYYRALKVFKKYKSHEQEGKDIVLPVKGKR